MEEEHKRKLYASLSLLCFNLFIVGMILVVSSYFSLLVLNIIASADIVFGIGIFLGFLSLVFWENSKGKWEIEFSKTKEELGIEKDNNLFFRVAPYLFLLLILIIAVNQFFKWDFVNAQMMRITILAITFGAVTFWRNRDGVENEIEKEDEEISESKRYAEFDKKFPSISRIWGLRHFAKWMYREGWSFSIPLVLITIIFIAIRVGMPLIYTGSYIDEYYHIFSATSIINGGGVPSFYRIDDLFGRGGPMLGGLIVTFVTALFFFIGKVSLFSAKLVPACIGIINFFLVCSLSKILIKNKSVRLLLLFVYTISPWVIFNDFYIRMYVFYEFFLLLAFYSINLLYKGKSFRALIIIFLIIVPGVILSHDNRSFLALIPFMFFGISKIKIFAKKMDFLFIAGSTLIIVLNSFNLLNVVGILEAKNLIGFPNFFFNMNLILTLLFLGAVVASLSSKNNFNFYKLVIFSAFVLFVFHITLVPNAQFIRTIFYFLPLFYLVSFSFLDKLVGNVSRLFLFFIIIIIIFSMASNYPKDYLLQPNIPSEIDYVDYGAISQWASINCQDRVVYSLITNPYIPTFYGTKVDQTVYIRPNLLMSDGRFYLSGSQYFDAFKNIPVISTQEEFESRLKEHPFCIIVPSAIDQNSRYIESSFLVSLDKFNRRDIIGSYNISLYSS